MGEKRGAAQESAERPHVVGGIGLQQRVAAAKERYGEATGYVLNEAAGLRWQRDDASGKQAREN
jgi:hypothetical protein